MNDTRYAIQLVEKFLDGLLSGEELLSAWPPMDNKSSQSLFNCWHVIYHYNTDTDIRNKEPEYDEILRKNIAKRLTELKAEIP